MRRTCHETSKVNVILTNLVRKTAEDLIDSQCKYLFESYEKRETKHEVSYRTEKESS